MRPQFRQKALPVGREDLIEALSHHQAQSSVAQELQPLVREEACLWVLVEVGAVDEGLAQKMWIMKGDAQTLFQALPVVQRLPSLASRPTGRENDKTACGRSA